MNAELPEVEPPEVTSDEWNVINEPHFEEVVSFGHKSGRIASLLGCFEQLNRLARNLRASLTLFPDFAPYSFYWTLQRDGKQVYNGGVIFHGAHDRGGDGGAPTFSVCLTATDGWAIHT